MILNVHELPQTSFRFKNRTYERLFSNVIETKTFNTLISRKTCRISRNTTKSPSLKRGQLSSSSSLQHIQKWQTRFKQWDQVHESEDYEALRIRRKEKNISGHCFFFALGLPMPHMPSMRLVTLDSQCLICLAFARSHWAHNASYA